MGWVPAPLANYPASTNRWRNVVTFLNGGGEVLQSGSSRREFDWVWGVQSAEALHPVLDTLARNELIYTLDPIAMKNNVVPSYWAAPTHDSPSLLRDVKHTLVDPIVSLRGYDAPGLRYVTGGVKETKLKIPVPAGHTLRLGVHGTGAHGWSFAENPNVVANTLSVGTATLTNLAITGPTMATLRTPNGTVRIHGIVAQVLPTGSTFRSGRFIPGMGFTGLKLKNDPQITSYSSEIPNAQIGVSASFMEVGAWQ